MRKILYSVVDKLFDNIPFSRKEEELKNEISKKIVEKYKTETGGTEDIGKAGQLKLSTILVKFYINYRRRFIMLRKELQPPKIDETILTKVESIIEYFEEVLDSEEWNTKGDEVVFIRRFKKLTIKYTNYSLVFI